MSAIVGALCSRELNKFQHIEFQLFVSTEYSDDYAFMEFTTQYLDCGRILQFTPDNSFEGHGPEG
jgi:hypothetical protein